MKPILLIIALITYVSARARPGGGRIFGGEAATPGQFPHQASYQFRWGGGDWSHFCGGSIISPTWVVTAAHCITEGPLTGQFRVVLGTTSLNDENEEIIVNERIVHPDFDGNVNPNDIALLKLEKEIVFNELVQPIKLPERGFEASGDAIASGWGAVDASGFEYPDVLQHVTLPIVNLKDCRDAIDKLVGSDEDLLDDASNVCTGPLTGGKSTCNGDSGGPLTQNGTLIGIVSWGFSICGYEGAPSVYTNVSNFIDFIESHVDDLPKV